MSRHRHLLSYTLASLALLLVAGLCSPSARLERGSAGERRNVSGAVPSNGALAPAEEDLYHWRQLPVRLFISVEKPEEQPWARVATAGFDEWVAATGGVVGYMRVDDPSHAQITVRFVPTEFVPGHPDLVGLTTLFWIGPVLQKAEIILATGQKSPSDLQTAAAHELGHALGIRGHSEDEAALMYPAPIRPTEDGAPAPEIAHPVTARDLALLKLCYPALFPAKTARAVVPGSP